MRLILPVAEAARRSLPSKSFIACCRPSTARTISLVTPRIVRSPFTSHLPAPFAFADFDLKVSFGNFATSKKSGLFRWPSRFSWSVSIEAASMSAVKASLSGAFGSYSAVPVKVAKPPFTVEIPKCGMVKPTAEWAVSRV